MATLTVDQFLKNLEGISNIANNRETNIRLARRAREIIYRRVKSGYGVTNDKSDSENVDRSGLKALSKSYIDYRKGLVIFRTGKSGQVYPIFNKKSTGVKKGKTSSGRGRINGGVFGRGAQSRISFNSLNSIKAPTLGEFGRPAKSNLTLTGQMLNAIMVLADDGSLELYIANTSRIKPDGTPDKLTNKQVAELVAKNGRPWFALTSGELRIITRELELIIQKEISRMFGA